MNNFRLLLLFSFVAFVYPVSSQSLLGSKYPLGIPLHTGTGPSLSIGGAGTGVDNDYYGMSENPANLGNMNRALFSGLLSYRFLQISDKSKSTLHAAFQPKSFFFSFPVASYGSLGFAFNQLSETDVKFNKQETITVDKLLLSSPRGMVIEGGSVGWQMGYGLTLLKKIRLGLMYERMYYKNSITKFKLTAGALSDSLIDSTGILISSNGFSGGIMYSIGKFTLGFSGKAYSKGNGEFYSQYKGTQRYIDNDSIGKDKINSSSTTDEVKLPPSLSFGASYQFKPEWLFATDFDLILWEKYYSNHKLQAEDKSKLSNALNISFGAQYIPAPNLLTPKYYEIIQYRTGLRITKLPGADAFESAVTLGAGLPIKKGGGIFDLFIEAGRRWDRKYSDYSENFFGIQIGLNGGQKWFQSSDEGY